MNVDGVAVPNSGAEKELSDADVAESSSAGLRRMKRLFATSTNSASTSSQGAIHPHTSTLIFPAPSPAPVRGCLSTPLFSHSKPRLLSTPSAFTPGEELSLSPEGNWTILFHPNSTSAATPDTGGTLAIYDSGIIHSPLSTSGTIAPYSTYQLLTRPLNVTHLYSPRTHTSNGRAPPLGPRPPPTHDEAHGPTFVVLTSTELILIYPQLMATQMPIALDATGQVISAPSTSMSWNMSALRAPLHTRWRAVDTNPPPPFTSSSKAAARGWIGLVPKNEGIWVAWESGQEVRVTTAQVGMDRSGRTYLQTTPLPFLPRIQSSSNGHGRQTQTRLQTVMFVSSPHESGLSTANEPGRNDHGAGGPLPVEKVNAVFIYQDTTRTSASSAKLETRTRIERYSFERREVELAEGFNHISSGNAETNAVWDWTVVPDPATLTSPTHTTIVAIHPLPSLSPDAVALVLLATPTGIALSHLHLTANAWTLSSSTNIEDRQDEADTELVPSQAVLRGQKGLVAIVGKRSGAALVVVPRVDSQGMIGEKPKPEVRTDASVADASTAIILAERQRVDWSDVVRAWVGTTPSSERKELLSSIFERVHVVAGDEVGVDELDILLRVQVAFFSATNDPSLNLASDILRLKEASTFVDRCATIDEHGRISLNLDSIWPMISVFEWAIGCVSDAMRKAILLGAQMDWDGDENSASSETSSVLIFMHPTLRALVIRILSQLSQFTSFLDDLDRPILQPESRYLPPPLRRDPMATIVARDRVRGLGYGLGLDIGEWGTALEQVVTPDDASLQDALLNLNPRSIQPTIKSVLQTLPSSSTLFISQEAHADKGRAYDAIDFSPLPADRIAEGRKCTRCHWTTMAPARTLTNSMGGGVSPWESWKAQWEERCICGGSWSKA